MLNISKFVLAIILTLIFSCRGADDATELVVAPQVIDTRYVTVDYTKSFAKMVAEGRFDEVVEDVVSENFPIKGHGRATIELKLLNMKRIATTQEVEGYLGSHGLRPATIAELLVFGSQYRLVQRSVRIVALGSVWILDDGRRYVPILSVHVESSSLGRVPADPLMKWDSKFWPDYPLFLVASK